MNKLILIGLFSINLLATTFQIKSQNVNYQAQFNADKISLKGNLIDISMLKKSCNNNLFRALLNDFKKNTKVIVNDKTEQRDSYLLSMNDKTFKVPKDSRLGKYIYAFPLRLQKAKKLEKLNCL